MGGEMTPEGLIQSKVLAFARRHGVETLRLALMPGVAAGWPDSLLLFPGGRAAFYEFKRPGGRLSDLQKVRLERLRGLGFTAEVFDNADAACSAVVACLGTPPLHGAGG